MRRSRLQKIEDKKNKHQAVLFILLSIGFILLLFFIGVPLLIKAAVFLGDLNASSAQLENQDTIPPVPPRFVQILEATTSAKLGMRGFAEPGSTIKLRKNGTEVAETITKDDGVFTFDTVELDRARNRFSAVAIDESGNISNASPTYSILYDNQAPDLEVTSPEDGEQFFEEERQIIVAGETEEDARVRVNGFIAEVDETNGFFTIPIQLVEGINDITVVATDPAGNTTQASLSVTFTR